jgi:hypothetical protein
MTHWLILSFCAAFSFIPAQNSPQWKGAIVNEGDVTVIRNPKEPMFKGQVFSYAEELSIPTSGPQDQYLIRLRRGAAGHVPGGRGVHPRTSSPSLRRPEPSTL